MEENRAGNPKGTFLLIVVRGGTERVLSFKEKGRHGRHRSWEDALLESP